MVGTGLALLVVLILIALAGLGALAWHTSSELMGRREPDKPVSPADLGLEYEPVAFASRDGLRLGGWFVPAVEPARGTVAFCHGHAGSLDPDLQYVPAFHQRGYHVLQFDFRAHGRSEGRHVSMGFYERLDLLGALDYLRDRGLDRVGVLGFSMGGAVAISTAAQCPSIAAVVSDGGFARLEPTLQAGLRARGVPPWLTGVLASLAIRLAGLRLGCDLRAADPLRWVGQVSPRPLLFIHGGRDTYVAQDQVEGLHTAAGNPKELWIVPEAEHRQVDQVQPEEYTARILSFFDQWLAREEDDA